MNEIDQTNQHKRNQPSDEIDQKDQTNEINQSNEMEQTDQIDLPRLLTRANTDVRLPHSENSPMLVFGPCDPLN